LKKNKGWMLLLTMLLITSLLAACSSGGESSQAGEDISTDPADIKGEITVLTQRTDIVDTVFRDYAAAFNKEYPDVKVNFQALADYEGQVKIRMSTKDYGDVLMIPTSVPIADIPDFFEPLGTYDELKDKYTGIEERMVDGQVYGIPTVITFSGIIYNKQVFKDAGITEVPKTPEQFQAALQLVKDNTDAIPLYTNYASGWALTQWESDLATVAGSVDYVNIDQPNTDENFVAGKPHYELYKVLYDAAKNGLIEKDPTTTDWESSKADLANGKIATMALGSWAITQIQGLTDTPDNIGFLPFPTNASDVVVPLAADYNIGMNVNSENKPAAKAWIDWFLAESNYAVEQGGGMSADKNAELPPILDQYKDVTFSTLTPAKEGQEGLVDKIDNEGEIGLWQPDFKKRIIEAAIGNRSESYDDIMKDLNDKWVKARAELTK
jgi:ABC-type glycerol-3-phosphate transport system substrate-binding protein